MVLYANNCSKTFSSADLYKTRFSSSVFFFWVSLYTVQPVLLMHRPKTTLLQTSNFSFLTIELDFSGFTSGALFKLILVKISLVTKLNRHPVNLCIKDAKGEGKSYTISRLIKKLINCQSEKSNPRPPALVVGSKWGYQYWRSVLVPAISTSKRNIKVYAGIATLALAREPSAKAKSWCNRHIGDRTYSLACGRRARVRCTNCGLQSVRIHGDLTGYIPVKSSLSL